MKRGFAAVGIILILLIFSITACQKEAVLTPEQKLASAVKTSQDYYEVDADTANYLYRTEPNLIIIDASKSYVAGHLPNTINIPADEIQSRLAEIDTSRTYIVYSDTEASSKAAAELIAAASQSVYRLVGEYESWATQGYELDTKKCHLTVGATPAAYAHTHVWCEEDAETKVFCITSEKCHTHRILKSQNLATDGGPGPHNHYLGLA